MEDEKSLGVIKISAKTTTSERPRFSNQDDAFRKLRLKLAVAY